jgi:hypothetical protein
MISFASRLVGVERRRPRSGIVEDAEQGEPLELASWAFHGWSCNRWWGGQKTLTQGAKWKGKPPAAADWRIVYEACVIPDRQSHRHDKDSQTMRLSRSVAIGLLCASNVASEFVSQDGYPWPWPHRPRTTTIVDLLSTNEQFGPLIRALQRAMLIPVLNAADNVTLLAPIADAMNEFDGDVTKELLMYHILNGSVLSDMVEDEVVVESILKMDPKDNTSLGVGVKIEKQGDRGRGQGILWVGGCARVVKSDWEANNGMS